MSHKLLIIIGYFKQMKHVLCKCKFEGKDSKKIKIKITQIKNVLTFDKKFSS